VGFFVSLIVPLGVSCGCRLAGSDTCPGDYWAISRRRRSIACRSAP